MQHSAMRFYRQWREERDDRKAARARDSAPKSRTRVRVQAMNDAGTSLHAL